MELATQVCQEDGLKNSQLIHYLACAYAECGNFNTAVQLEQQAIRLNPPTHPSWLPNFQKALALFQSQKPVHEFMQFDE